MYLARTKQVSSRQSASERESSPDVTRTSDAAPATSALTSETELTRWLARADASSEEGPLAASAVQAILEAFACSALVARTNGVVLFANTAARADLEAGRLDVLRCLDGDADSDDVTITIYPLSRGDDGYERAFILRNDPLVAAAARVDRAAVRWALTPHQTEVLRLLVHGEGNKCIADRRGCSLRTVEVHMTALFKRSRTSSRAELIARFWTLG